MLKPSVFGQTNQPKREGALHSSHNSIFNEQRVFPPKNLSFVFEGTRKILSSTFASKPFSKFLILFPVQGTKNLSAEFSLPHSATELLRIKWRHSIHATETVKTFFSFSSSFFVRDRSRFRKNTITVSRFAPASKAFFAIHEICPFLLHILPIGSVSFHFTNDRDAFRAQPVHSCEPPFRVFPALNANPTGDLAGPALGDRDAGRLQDLSGRLLKTTSQTSKPAPRSQTYCQRQQPEKTLPAKRESSQVTANAALNSSSRQEMVKFWKTIQPLPAQTVAAAALHLARNMPFGISDNRQVALRWGEQLNG
jgi:hypothetical protein